MRNTDFCKTVIREPAVRTLTRERWKKNDFLGNFCVFLSVSINTLIRKSVCANGTCDIKTHTHTYSDLHEWGPGVVIFIKSVFSFVIRGIIIIISHSKILALCKENRIECM